MPPRREIGLKSYNIIPIFVHGACPRHVCIIFLRNNVIKLQKAKHIIYACHVISSESNLVEIIQGIYSAYYLTSSMPYETMAVQIKV